jgi:molybdopterin-guanine dinucleotide biosynthesis protein A
MAFEPFCAIYTSTGLKPIKDLVDIHALQNFSFQHVLHAGKTKCIDIVDNSSFKNFNNASDIE